MKCCLNGAFLIRDSRIRRDKARTRGGEPRALRGAEITGTAKVGEKLTVTSIGWEPADVTLTYAWFRDGAQLPGIDTASYTVSKYNIGKQMTVKVTASADGYADASVTTAPTAKVVGMTLKTASPTISGTRQVGHTLTAKAGSWTSGTKLSYQWYRDGPGGGSRAVAPSREESPGRVVVRVDAAAGVGFGATIPPEREALLCKTS